MLVDLPEDILLAIITNLKAVDLLSLNQTCRVLHALGSADYVWHQMKVDLPLDLPPSFVDADALSGADIHNLTIKALRLEQNWQQEVSQIRNVTRIMHGDTVSQMQLLGSSWVVTLSRSATTARLSVWSLKISSAVYCITSFDVQVTTFKFSASIIPGPKREAIISLITRDSSREDLLSAYYVSLEEEVAADERSYSTQSSAPHTIPWPKTEGSFVEVHSCGHIVACAAIRPNNSASFSYRIFLINLLTRRQVLVDTGLSSSMTRIRFRLFPDCIAFAGVREAMSLAICTYALPEAILDTSTSSVIDTLHQAGTLGPTSDGFEALLADYQTRQISTDFDFHLFNDPAFLAPLHASVVIFHSYSGQELGKAETFQFPLRVPIEGGGKLPNMKQPTHRYTTPISASAEIVCMGKTGRRAVWLERRWDTDEFRLMKASFGSPGEPVMVQRLLPRHLALPFEPQTCCSLGFDEATGRVCLGLHTGELYILDF